MSIISNTAIAFSMSVDAFAAATSKGVALKKPKFSHALKIGLIFGSVEAATPIIGWLLGLAASSMIAAIDHWVAFGILTIIGSKMLYDGFQEGEAERKESHHIGILLLTAIGTSIYAMAIGVMIALLDKNIWVMALMIGTATFLMATIGIMTGHYIGTKSGKIAERLGGLCLIAIGIKILIEHLSV